MNYLTIALLIATLMWFIRLEIEVSNLKEGKHYALYNEDGWKVAYLNEDGSLQLNIAGKGLISYKKAMGIKKLYPHLQMINEQTGEAVE